MDLDTTMTVRERLMFAAKGLFAANGYEQTSTASIAREAATSESQLIRCFGSKSGLLEAIFETAWDSLHERVLTVTAAAPSARAAMLAILSTLTDSFSRDPDLAFLFLFEGRRVRRSDHDVFVSRGFQRFNALLHHLVERGVADQSFRKELNSSALVSALLGAAEGMMRDRMVALRAGAKPPYEEAEMRKVVEAILEGV